jgi:flagellar hook assembly protein FlgD
VTLEIYNVAGARVATLVDEYQNAGSKIAHWDGRDINGTPVTSGVYLYKLQAGSFAEIRKMILLR